jgi:hypothetical protein
LAALTGLEGARFGANMSVRGYFHVNSRVLVAEMLIEHTALFIPACLRAVRGVLPRSFPGVLKMSATLLFVYQLFQSVYNHVEKNIHIPRSKYRSHMLV